MLTVNDGLFNKQWTLRLHECATVNRRNSSDCWKKKISAAIIQHWALPHFTSVSGNCGPRRPIKSWLENTECNWSRSSYQEDCCFTCNWHVIILSLPHLHPTTHLQEGPHQRREPRCLNVSIQQQGRTCNAPEGRVVSSPSLASS